MLFTSAAFIGVFLPIVLVGFFCIGRFSHAGAALWIFVASLIFYGYWMPQATFLLLASIIGNYLVGGLIHSSRAAQGNSPIRARMWLVFGVVSNLSVLAYFKYANFFVDSVNVLIGGGWHIAHVVLPIGISFFTFTQIAFLVDSWQKGVHERNPVHYGLFVTYFPHLIAGPVLHHAQLMPQLRLPATYRFNSKNFNAGLAIFVLGMFKKVVLADGISPYADAIFDASPHGELPNFEEAWLAAIAYSLQLYFDFSGYSDMAIGLSWMLNIRLPFNFNSPYRATSISEFWRRWHMSLSQFLRDYLYFALGGNQKGKIRRHVNLMITMVLGGLWHGASWSFILWGFLHGLYLIVNHAFRALCGPRLRERLAQNTIFSLFAWLLTMFAVVVAWVLFRAKTIQGATDILHAMASPTWSAIQPLLWNAGLTLHAGTTWCVIMAALACFNINSNQIGTYLLRSLGNRACAMVGGASFALLLFLLIVNTSRKSASAFIYFNF